MELSLLSFPKKSHRKFILLPSESNDLAELLGIIMGDGGINNGWQVVISLNAEKDKDYALYVKVLLEKLFGITVAQRKRPNQNTTTIIATSTTLVDFLVKKGAAKGNKITSQIDIPLWVKGNRDYIKHFVRGLVDTDGCLYIHKHTIGGKLYRNIGFCFTNFSSNLLLSVSQVFKNHGLRPHITNKRRRIYFYSEQDVIKYLDIFGSSNPRIYNLYNEWKEIKVSRQ